jgi:hypothetical protein
MAQDSDEHLIRYILGELPDGEAERLDERSITDDAFAARLRVLEDDIVDRYARGESLGVSLARFQQAQRASPYLREKVRFAESLAAWSAKAQAVRPRPSTHAFFGLGTWALAAAAILMVVAGGYLVRTNQRLRSEFARLEAQHLVVEQQNAQLHRQLEAPPVARPTPPAAVTATFVLPPPRRGLEREATIVVVPKDTKQLAFRLQVESDAYPRFWAALKDVASGAIVWRSPDVAAEPAGANRIATIVIPADILRPQRYAIELVGVGKSGASELLGAYAVRVTFE